VHSFVVGIVTRKIVVRKFQVNKNGCIKEKPPTGSKSVGGKENDCAFRGGRKRSRNDIFILTQKMSFVNTLFKIIYKEIRNGIF
jgi:hypothetical protein